jgi:hypothetical protein
MGRENFKTIHEPINEYFMLFKIWLQQKLLLLQK